MMTILVAIFLLARAQQAPAAAPASHPDLVLPGRVISDGTAGNPDDVVFKVGGVPVTRREWKELIDFRRKVYPQRPMADIVVNSVHDLARLKVVTSHFAERAKQLAPRLEEIKAKLEELKQKCGNDSKALLEGFGQLCNQYSEDPTIRAFGHDGRTGNILHGQTQYPFDICVFERCEVGKISEPYATLHGYEIFLVEELKHGAAPMFDAAIPRRLLLQWDSSDRKVAKRADALLSRTIVEIVDPVFKQLVPPGLLMGPGDRPFKFSASGKSDGEGGEGEPAQAGQPPQDKAHGDKKDGDKKDGAKKDDDHERGG